MANAISVKRAARNEVRDEMRVTTVCWEKDRTRAMNVTAVAGRVRISYNMQQSTHQRDEQPNRVSKRRQYPRSRRDQDSE